MSLDEPGADAHSRVALVSFLIVAHNAGPFLRPCIASVLGQTYPRVEVVLVDCASTDGVVDAVALEFAGSQAVRVVRHETNLGPASGAMLGLPQCRGEFVARLDADDLALPDRIVRQVGYLQAHPEKDAVGGDVLRLDAAGNPLGAGLSLRGEFMRRHAAMWYIGCFHTTLLVRRSVLMARGYNPTLFTSSDHELIEWIARDGGLGVLPLVTCLYRQHANSITARLDALQRLSGNEVRRLLSRSIGQSERRADIALLDFAFVSSDPRLQLSRSARNRWFEDDSREHRDWLGAAYFASINGRWLHFVGWLARAATGGTPWRELVALLSCRTLWPVRLRLASAGVTIITKLARAGSPIESSLRVAAFVNRLRSWRRISAAAAVMLLLGYFGLKPVPSMRDVPWLPRTIIAFADRNNFLCNVAAFAVASAVMEAGLGGLSLGGRAAYLRRTACMAGLVVGIEVAQIFLPRRVFDPMDIVAGWLGVLLAAWVFLPAPTRARCATPADRDAAGVTLAR